MKAKWIVVGAVLTSAAAGMGPLSRGALAQPAPPPQHDGVGMEDDSFPGMQQERGGRPGEGGPRRRERIRRFLEERLGGDGESPELPAGPGAEGGGPGGGGLGRPRRVNNYLQFAESFVASVSDRPRAIGLAALGIRDAYRRQGKASEALPVFEELLASTKDQTERNIYLFLIRQSYQESNDMQKFLEINKQIIKENSAK